LIQKKKGSRPSRPGAGSTRCFASEPKAYFPAPADVGQQELLVHILPDANLRLVYLTWNFMLSRLVRRPGPRILAHCQNQHETDVSL
jgi:hypothetical protein